jgi:hypothetical protein
MGSVCFKFLGFGAFEMCYEVVDQLKMARGHQCHIGKRNHLLNGQIVELIRQMQFH